MGGGDGGIFGFTYMMGILKEPVHFTLYLLDFEKLSRKNFLKSARNQGEGYLKWSNKLIILEVAPEIIKTLDYRKII